MCSSDLERISARRHFLCGMLAQMRFLVDYVSTFFLFVIGSLLIVVATAVLIVLGDSTAAFLVSSPGTVLLLAGALFLYGIGKDRWVSSDWLVEKITAYRAARGQG